VTPTGIDPKNVRLVAKCLNHYATPGPINIVPFIIYDVITVETIVNPLNIKLNPISHLLALLGAHHILHVSRIEVNSYITTHSFK
jgi:hypothetical protein